MFLSKSVVLAAITSVPAEINSIPAGTRTESSILAETELWYISTFDGKLDISFTSIMISMKVAKVSMKKTNCVV